MSEKMTMLQSVTPEQMIDLFGKEFDKRFKAIAEEIKIQKDKEILLTRKEVCEFFQINPSTLFHWVNKGKINAYGISGRRYYKKAELMNSLTLLSK
jgi:hypothetical protein